MNNSKHEQETKKQNGKILEGKVVSVAMQKTVVVAVVHSVRHPLYRKVVRKTRKFAVHNENLTLVAGDMVRMREVKPISKQKHFTVIEKI